MNNERNSFKNEYHDMLEFILELQEQALKTSSQLLSRKKELEYKKKQQEYMLEEKEKMRTPNISMFSPLDTEDIYESDVALKDELTEIESQLEKAKKDWEHQKSICSSFERLKSFFINIETNMQENNLSGKNTDYLADYSTKLLETQEMDRNRISRDLHDSTVQSLTSLVHKTEFCSKLVDKDPVRVKLELQSMIDLNKEIINDMREIIYDLRPMSLNNIGLVSTIESYCLHLRRNYNMDLVFTVDGEEKGLSSIVSVTLYRIIQEACNNAIRHSSAKRVSIRISYFNHDIELDIEDDGVGFDIIQIENQAKEDVLHGFGLSTMRERAKLLSGSFDIKSKPGEGTRIHIIVPIKYISENGE